MSVFKNSKANRDKVASVLQNGSKNLSWNEVAKELEVVLQANTFMFEWVKVACSINASARNARLQGKIPEAMKLESEFEQMIESGKIFRKSA